jgi:tape measure domain-containing protein
VQYAKLESQISSATKQLTGYEAQMKRAKESVSLQESGILKLSDSMRSAETISRSYVERLQAEGKATEANKAESAGLQTQLGKMQEMYKLQVTELEKVAQASGKSSAEYAKQSVRVNETATKMAQAKTRMTELDEAISKANPSVFDRLRSSIVKTNDSTEKTESLFKKVLSANMISNALSNAWSTITSKIREARSAGMEYLKEQDQMNAVWLTLTGNAKAGQNMVDMTNQLSVSFGQDVDLVNELNQQFYHVLDNEPATKKLTQAVLTMGDAVGLSSDNLKNLGLNFTHMMSSSLLQLGDFNHITDALPMYGEALLEYEQKVQKNSKLTMAELRKEMSAGKISAKDAEVVMEELGNKYQPGLFIEFQKSSAIPRFTRDCAALVFHPLGAPIC